MSPEKNGVRNILAADDHGVTRRGVAVPPTDRQNADTDFEKGEVSRGGFRRPVRKSRGPSQPCPPPTNAAKAEPR
jgi:hypothetical protein